MEKAIKIFFFKFFINRTRKASIFFWKTDSSVIAQHMNKNNYPRRGLIKRGLTLIGGIFFLGAVRSTFGATKTAEPDVKIKRVSRGRGMTQHCIEGISLGLPMQHLENNKDLH